NSNLLIMIRSLGIRGYKSRCPNRPAIRDRRRFRVPRKADFVFQISDLQVYLNPRSFVCCEAHTEGHGLTSAQEVAHSGSSNTLPTVIRRCPIASSSPRRESLLRAGRAAPTLRR